MKAGNAYRGQRVFVMNTPHENTFQYKEATIVGIIENTVGAKYALIKRDDIEYNERRFFTQLLPINQEKWLETRVILARINLLMGENFTTQDAIEEVLNMIRIHRPEEDPELYREQIQILLAMP